MHTDCPFCGDFFDSSLLLDDHVMEGCPMDSDLTPDISMDTNIGSDTDEEVSLILFDFLFCWLENAVCATQLDIGAYFCCSRLLKKICLF